MSPAIFFGAQAIQALLATARDPAASLAATLMASVLPLLGATTVFVELKGSLDDLWVDLAAHDNPLFPSCSFVFFRG